MTPDAAHVAPAPKTQDMVGTSPGVTIEAQHCLLRPLQSLCRYVIVERMRCKTQKYKLKRQSYCKVHPKEKLSMSNLHCHIFAQHMKLMFLDITVHIFKLVQFDFIYSRILSFLRSVTSGLRRPPPLTCSVVHAAAFAVNVDVVTSQYHFWSLRCDPTEDRTHACQLWWHVLNQLHP